MQYRFVTLEANVINAFKCVFFTNWRKKFYAHLCVITDVKALITLGLNVGQSMNQINR